MTEPSQLHSKRERIPRCPEEGLVAATRLRSITVHTVQHNNQSLYRCPRQKALGHIPQEVRMAPHGRLLLRCVLSVSPVYVYQLH